MHPMASLFSQKALINVVGGKVPEVAKSQMTRPLTTVFYALGFLSRVSCPTYTHTMSFLRICAVLLSSCLRRCLRGEESEQSLTSASPCCWCLSDSLSAVPNCQQFYAVNIREHINNAGADGVPLYPAFMPSTPFTLLACNDCSFPCTDGGQGARSRRCDRRRKEQQFQFSALSTNSKNRWILEQKSI